MIEQPLVYPDSEVEEPPKTMREVKFDLFRKSMSTKGVPSRILLEKGAPVGRLIGLRI
jgi:hypothetical protein